MLNMQKELYEANKDNWEPIEPKYARNTILWMMAEIGELLDIIKKRGEKDIMEDKILRESFVEELVDIEMYFMDILMRYNISGEEFSEAYRNKNTKNINRNFIKEYDELKNKTNIL